MGKLEINPKATKKQTRFSVKEERIIQKMLALDPDTINKLKTGVIKPEEVLSDKEDKEVLANLKELKTRMLSLHALYLQRLEQFNRKQHTGARIHKYLEEIDKIWDNIQHRHSAIFGH